jgi:phosphatidylglycerol:prolipoprotein diacylglycerol transferase
MSFLAYPDISPVIFSIGPLAVRWYSLAYLVGILAAWFMVSRTIKKYNLPLTRQNLEDLVFYVTLGIILGGRFGYVIFYGGDMFWRHPLEIFALWHGGMSFHGGILGVIIALYLASGKIKYGFLSLTDLACLFVPVGIFLGRLANFANDELWGRVTDVPWAVRFPSGGYLPRHPSQIYEACLEGLSLLILLNILWHFRWVRTHTGFVSGTFLAGYGLARIALEQFREPDRQLGFIFGSITMGQILSTPFIILGLYLVIRAWHLTKTDDRFQN